MQIWFTMEAKLGDGQRVKMRHGLMNKLALSYYSNNSSKLGYIMKLKERLANGQDYDK